MQLPIIVSQPHTHTQIIEEYRSKFAPYPDRGYSVMNSSTALNKYFNKKRSPLLSELLEAAFNDEKRQTKEGAGTRIPQSICGYIECEDYAKNIVIDVDFGGIEAVQKVLGICTQYNIKAFVDLSKSQDTKTRKGHDGGHVFILTTPQPANLLASIAARILAESGVEGESYPGNPDQTIRLPQMPNLWAPGGPRRFPLLFQDGEIIDNKDPWVTLAQLLERCEVNSTKVLQNALISLPPLSVDNPVKRHSSKVNPAVPGQVIDWYNDNFPLDRVLLDQGISLKAGMNICPMHDDHTPSLSFFQTRGGKWVVHCFSQNSNCEWADRSMDAFNIYSKGLSVSEAVRQLADEYKLGKKKEKCIEVTNAPIVTNGGALEESRIILAALKPKRGVVIAVNGTPGLGKTFAGVALANQWHQEGKKVAIVVPTHEHGELEWFDKLDNAYMWLPRGGERGICECFSNEYKKAVAANNHAMKPCFSDCPYRLQDAEGKITIFQYQYLHLNDGKLLEEYDLIIVDESCMQALLNEREVSKSQLKRFHNMLIQKKDSASALIAILFQIIDNNKSLGAAQMGEALKAFPNLDEVLLDAGRSFYNTDKRKPVEPDADLDKLVPMVLDGILVAIKNNALALDNGTLKWFSPEPLLKESFSRADPPAVLILDGSAKKIVLEKLCQPWPVEVIDLPVVLDSKTRIIQAFVTSSTRRHLKEVKRQDSTIRTMKGVAKEFDIQIQGGVCYKSMVPALTEAFGDKWLWFGNQRGHNELAKLTCIAIVASPTIPQDTIERTARALFGDVSMESTKAARGLCVYTDERVEAINQLYSMEELRQALHRCRPIIDHGEPVTIFVFTPWDITSLGFTPTHTIKEWAYGNSKESYAGAAAYDAGLGA